MQVVDLFTRSRQVGHVIKMHRGTQKYGVGVFVIGSFGDILIIKRGRVLIADRILVDQIR